jgi:uncharacterized protein (DUF1501 family)
MRRRDFLAGIGLGGLVALSPTLAVARSPQAASRAGREGTVPAYPRRLILVELKGGNDGLNTVVPYADPRYYALRPQLAIPREQVLALDARLGLHPALQPLMAAWGAGELAVLQGVGYPQSNLSHFRAIEIWDTASRSDQYLQSGWLARAFERYPVPAAFAADGVIVGSDDMGPLSGSSRAVVLANPQQFAQQAQRLAMNARSEHMTNPALAHLLRVESGISAAGRKLAGGTGRVLTTEFPKGGFGGTVKSAAHVLAQDADVAVLRLTLSGFDTHRGQAGTQANLLKQLSDGLLALRSAVSELGQWNDTLILTYAEFGRRPQENQSGGTDHGTASAHFALGGAIRGGLYGTAPDLGALDRNGNLAHAIDFRCIYATVLERWWGLDPVPVVGPGFAALDRLIV